VTNLRKTNPLGAHIQLPKIPSILSESIVLNWFRADCPIEELRGCKFALGGRDSADILAEKPGLKSRSIEVKATGQAGFQNFMEKDIRADYIVWLHFGDYFENPARDYVEAYVVTNPGTHFPVKRAYVNLTDIAKLPSIKKVRLSI
jgi:hypothetical protein